MSERAHKPRYLFNKKIFSRLGVIFEREGNIIRSCHIPACGMDAETAKELAKWLSKRAKEINLAKIERGEL